ncbi:MAG TPA: alpha/beta hydrolase [Acidimicrobiales bacterium]|nr:alpha/beta hydrolase [Acidimicrobiales bacterium]
MNVRSGRAELHADVFGPDVSGAGAPGVLLLHAGVADRRGWGPLVGALAPRHRGVAYDRRGFGDTTYEPEPHSPIDDALAVMDAAGLGRVVAVGNSQGGRLALDLALIVPDRIIGLVLIGTAVRGAPIPGELSPLLAEIDRAIDDAEAVGDLDEVNRLEARLWLDGPEAAEGRVRGAARELFLDMNGRALTAADPGREASLPPAWDLVGKVDVPVLVAVGELDLPHVVERSTLLAARLPRARLVVLPDVAHLPALEGSAALIAAVLDFLAAFDAP